MSFVVKIVKKLVTAVVNVIVDVVKVVWDEVVMPALEWVFSLIGIEDETIVTAQRISVTVFNNYDEDLVQKAITRAVIRKIKKGTTFFPSYMEEMYKTKNQIRQYYNYADRGHYVHGLPKLSIAGIALPSGSLTVVVNNIQSSTGKTVTLLDTHSGYLSPLQHFQNLLSSSHNYIPHSNTLTADDSYGVSRSDWLMDNNIVYNVATSDYTINYSRTAAVAKIWIEGPNSVTESHTAVFKIKSNRAVPAGKSLLVNLSYSGTAVNGINYNQVNSVTIPELMDEVEVSIQTIDLPDGGLGTLFDITIESVPNTGGVFEHVVISSPDTVQCSILTDDSVVLTTRDVIVGESGNAVIPFKLEKAVTGPFTVDYEFTNITATGGVDYDNTTGTLNFTGAADEIQNVVVPITADLIDDDKEKFEVRLTNCSDVTVDITRVSTVTIQDGSDDYPITSQTVSGFITGANFTPERHFIAKYYEVGTPESEYFYWYYKHSDNTLDIDPSSEALEDLEMLPVVVLRKDGVFCDTDKNSDLYKTTKKLMDKLSLDIDKFIENIAKSPGTDLNSISDAYVNFSMSPAASNKVMSKLLYLSFFDIIVTNGLFSEVKEYSATFKEGDINNSVVWTDHDYTTNITGTVTPVGDYTHTVIKTTSGSTLRLRHQVTAGSYSQINVHNLNSLSAIDYNGYHQVASSPLWNKDTNAVDVNFNMALSWAMFAKLTAKEQTGVYKLICRLDLYSLTVTELKWYETDAFADLFGIVMKALAVFTLGQSLVVSGVYAAARLLVTGYVIGELVVFVAEATGSVTLAAIVGVIASITTVNKSDFSDVFEVLKAMDLTEQVTLFAENFKTAYGYMQQKSIEELVEEGMLIDEATEKFEEEQKLREKAKNDSPITASFLGSLKSLEAQIITAIDSQYRFEDTFGYGMVDNYHNTHLTTEII